MKSRWYHAVLAVGTIAVIAGCSNKAADEAAAREAEERRAALEAQTAAGRDGAATGPTLGGALSTLSNAIDRAGDRLTNLADAQKSASGAALPGTGADAGKTVLYRDTWGVAHIYAPTAEAGLYAMGWAQAEDRGEQLLQNILIAIGEISSIAGPSQVQTDLRSRMFDHYGVAKREWNHIPPTVQSHVRAFARGMNDFFAAHPESNPPWWGARQIDEYMIIAFGRLFLYNWSIDEAYGDLKRGGIEPGYEAAQRGSNEWAVSSGRSAVGAPILYIDPHLSWWGPSRFWAVRIHAGELEGSGVTLPGSPYIGLGHNANVAWAMTTGGPDTADIFVLTLNEDGTKYTYDGEWREITKRDVQIMVREMGEETHTILESHLGPIVAMRDGKAYAAAMAYKDSVGNSTAWYTFNTATDYTGLKAGMSAVELFPQNVMVADTSGNLYYQRTGRVPIRPESYDYAVPVDGSTSKTAWQGIHPADDLLQVLNPPQGWMQNCNIPPDAMMPDSPFKLSETRDYIFASKDYGDQRDGWTNQRGARAVEYLSADDSVTIEEALALAVDTKVYGVERWLGELRKAHEKFGSQHTHNENYAKGIEDVLRWDGRLDPDSTGALKYYYWRRQMASDMGGAQNVEPWERQIDQWYKIVSGEPVTEPDLAITAWSDFLAIFTRAMDNVVYEMKSLDAKYGDKFRVGRDDASWPVGGGGDFGTRTLRSMSYEKEKDDHTQMGRSGQTSTQVVVLTKPIQSWWYLPVGQSDRKDSPHYDDLAEKAFSPGQLQPTWWLPEDLAGHIESRTELQNAPAAS